MYTTGSTRSRHLLSAPGPDIRHLCVILCDLIWSRCAVFLGVGRRPQGVQAGITVFLQVLLANAHSSRSLNQFPHRLLAMLLAQALRILCSQIINNKSPSLPVMREGRGLAAPGSEEP